MSARDQTSHPNTPLPPPHPLPPRNPRRPRRSPSPGQPDILPGLEELALLYALAHAPVHEGALGVHQVELVVQTGPGLGDGGGANYASVSNEGGYKRHV